MTEKNYGFDDIVLFARTGLNPRQNFKLGDGNNAYITIKNIHNNQLVIDENTDVINDDAIRKIHKRSQIKKGDILFASIGRLGDMYIIDEDPTNWDINESVFAFTLNTDLIRRKYFYYLFKHPGTIDYLAKNSSGSTFKSIKMNQLKKMSFRLPSLDEQDSIISKLDTTQKVIEEYSKQLLLLDKLIKSRFVELFGDPKLNPYHWPIKKVGDLVSDIRYGTSRPAVDGGAYPYLRMNNLTDDGRIDLSNLKYIDIPENELGKCVVRDGDVLFNRTNSIDLVGKTATYHFDNEMVIAGYIIRVRLTNNILPDFFSVFFNLDYMKEILKKMAKGAVNQANINAQELQSIKLYVPPVESQLEYVHWLNALNKSKLANHVIYFL